MLETSKRDMIRGSNEDLGCWEERRKLVSLEMLGGCEYNHDYVTSRKAMQPLAMRPNVS